VRRQALPLLPIQGIFHGTLIACEDGNVPVQAVRAGDIVNTLSDGPQVVRWVGRSLASTAVQFESSAFGPNTPDNPLLVGPAQRMVLSGWQPKVLFGESEVLVGAEALVNGENICLITLSEEVESYHILFDNHEIISANGAKSESFHPSKTGLSALAPASLTTLRANMPNLGGLNRPFSLVRPAISAAEAALLRGG